jgi:sigma-B regulation protein RsbU (phosphoserine phosphatase)
VVAEKLQRTLEVSTGTFSGLEVASVYHSASEWARLGGDFYDIFRMAGGRIGILIGDVSGRGLDAAAQAVFMRTSLRAFGHGSHSPAQVLTHANHLLVDMDGGGFVTAFFGVLDQSTGELLCASAGHPPALVTASGGPFFVEGPGPVRGVFEEAAFTETRLHLAPGDTLLLYTDGLTEARADGGLFGEARLLETVRALAASPASVLAQSLYAKAIDFAGGSLHDDVALLVVRVQPLEAT